MRDALAGASEGLTCDELREILMARPHLRVRLGRNPKGLTELLCGCGKRRDWSGRTMGLPPLEPVCSSSHLEPSMIKPPQCEANTRALPPRSNKIVWYGCLCPPRSMPGKPVGMPDTAIPAALGPVGKEALDIGSRHMPLNSITNNLCRVARAKAIRHV